MRETIKEDLAEAISTAISGMMPMIVEQLDEKSAPLAEGTAINEIASEMSKYEKSDNDDKIREGLENAVKSAGSLELDEEAADKLIAIIEDEVVATVDGQE